ncbi:protein jagged-2-like [Anoplophora glabripennis]|uniref:protein jagged-2-like n=1 Tax=Anoplophora glabripennis TaxID=217634 RepID=UPI000873C36B|nr:protein jagged-2-like [Anoplophora glabripennis]
MFFKICVLLFIYFETCKSCETGQTKQGCLIRNLMCACGYGCASDYRYDTYQECQSALKGKKKDICKTSNPCLHNGTCIQISQQPGYKCRCEGTGYFGLRCSKACPVPGGGRIGSAVFPYECIVI